MKQEIVYECEFCGYKSPDRAVIEKCESAGTPQQDLSIGDEVIYNDTAGGKIVEMNLRRTNFSRTETTHVWWYLITYTTRHGVRKRWFSALSVAKAL